MILLPDIRLIVGHLSIQDPFTLDGYLITEIDFAHHSSFGASHEMVRIKNENNYCIEVDINEINDCFQRKMSNFIARYGSCACVEGRRDIYDWNNYSLNRYINEIKKQCERISRSNMYALNNSYVNILKSDLRRQGRFVDEFREPEPNRPSRITVNPFYDAYHAMWCGQSTISSNSITAFGIDTSSSSYKTYIHKYTYKPEYIHHYMSDEDKDTTLLLGAEIEVDCGGESEEHAKNVLEIICGVNPDNNSEALEDKMYCTHDGSLKNGIEFDTMPCSLEYHKKEMKYKEMFKYLDEHGYKAHDTTTCGLHIHADRNYLGKSELVQQLTISKILYILEKFNDEICVIARRGNSYSKFVGNGKDEKSIIELYGKYKNQDKHVALNLKHKESIEFRCFKGTLKYDTFILTLEFVQNIIDYAKSINIEEVEKMKWSDLMNTFSDELKEYYNDRLEKEKLKKEREKEKEKESATFTLSNGVNLNNTTINASNLYINNQPVISLNSIEPTMYIDWSERAGRNLLNNECDISVELESSARGTWESLVTSCCTNYNGIISSINISSTKTEEEKIKDKINSLKKKIKNSNNFMKKKKLEKELNETQKELKKEKKKNKLNNNTHR